jgi:hypothetical protein
MRATPSNCFGACKPTSTAAAAASQNRTLQTNRPEFMKGDPDARAVPAWARPSDHPGEFKPAFVFFTFADMSLLIGQH